MLTNIFFLKLFLATSIVIGLSILAENVSPKTAGILSGYPTGSALSLFFFGLEVSPKFAAESAVFNMIGLTASMTFVFTYYLASTYFKKYNIFLSSISAIIGYFITTWGLHYIELNKFAAILVPIATAFIFIHLFKKIPNSTIKTKIKLSNKTLILRAILAASIILTVTGTAHLVGAKWAGLFSAFPTTLFPLMLIIHYTYDKKHVHTIIKNFPIGIFSLIAYSLSISIVYPLYGIYFGTLISFGIASVYLLIYNKIQSKL